MSIFKCKMCGGTLEINNNESVAECEYCGTMQTLPKLNDENKSNLYDRANHFRRNNDYDKAMSIYDRILNEDKTDAEAYWSLVLCRYGIEYVEDPATRKRVPTVNRAQFTSVFMDEDYKSAIKYADVVQKKLYEAEAKAIDEIQKGILAISQNEEPFDVFICYKESDSNGRRTQDSVLANDLYHQLTNEGFKVFFARITLEDKLGTAYEPYIFAALNSSKVMVVLGTKPEYFNAVWVKNEWSRYLALIKGGAKKVLIPAYRDMDPYDLPEEFSHLQAQDMSKLGFMQDLIRGIKKLAGTAPQPQTVVREVVREVQSDDDYKPTVTPLLKRAFMFLEDGDWSSANEYCEKVLDLDPENAQAYMGKLMAELKKHKREYLGNGTDRIDSNNNYQKAIRFADNTLKAELEGYSNEIKERIENNRKEQIYSNAKSLLSYAEEPTDLLHANKEFTRIGNYKDSKTLATKCLDKIYDKAKQLLDNATSESSYRIAAKNFNLIPNHRDSAELAKKCVDEAEKMLANQKDITLKSAEELIKKDTKADLENALDKLKTIQGWKNANELTEQCNKRIEEINAVAKKALEKKQTIKTAIACSLIAVTIAGAIVTTQVIVPSVKYNNAEQLLSEGKYDEAVTAFTELGDFKDSNNRISESTYLKAEKLYNNQDYFNALSNYMKLGNYKDAKEKYNTLSYEFCIRNSISAGGVHTVGLKSDGTVVAVGDNDCNECDVDDWTDIVAVSAGDEHTVGLKKDGTVVAVGNNDRKQCCVDIWTDIVAVSAGDEHTVGLKSDGTVVAVGDNYHNQCNVNDWKDIVAVSAGREHTVGLKSDGTVVAVGDNDCNQCDVYDWNDIVAISAVGLQTIGLKSDGSVVVAGRHYSEDNSKDKHWKTGYVEDWKNITAISTGNLHSIGLRATGRVVAVGNNYDGQCNTNAWNRIVSISGGFSYTVGLKCDGTVVAVGNNYFGQCDVDDWKDIYVPESIK
ncbi:MAG: TIR domain-containing protein [Acutalibacteraceae bacterium]|nr:TIR domain-containing protein [Acutalibacteraceae bacterium]